MTVEQIGAVVREARLARGLRQDQLAAAAGVGVRFLSELERGKPTVRLAKVLAKRAANLLLPKLAEARPLLAELFTCELPYCAADGRLPPRRG